MEEAPPGHVRLAPGVFVAERQVRTQTSRSGGPGGQSVNKLSSAVEIWVPLEAFVGLDEAALLRLRKLAGRRITQEEELHLRAEDSRSQRDNHRIVWQRLGELAARARIAPRPRKKTRPSRAAKQRRLEAKKRRGEKKQLRRSVG